VSTRILEDLLVYPRTFGSLVSGDSVQSKGTGELLSPYSPIHIKIDRMRKEALARKKMHIGTYILFNH
jgi:hypothetical protein